MQGQRGLADSSHIAWRNILVMLAIRIARKSALTKTKYENRSHPAVAPWQPDFWNRNYFNGRLAICCTLD